MIVVGVIAIAIVWILFLGYVLTDIGETSHQQQLDDMWDEVDDILETGAGPRGLHGMSPRDGMTASPGIPSDWDTAA